MVEKEEKKSKGQYNHLKDEKSPYLIQHAQNPVDWYPWGEEAFQKAKGENKPIFLSIGYSTCHWCHVMARESFEDPEIAELINDIFVPIKVDREEHPDIDCTYMVACQIITGGGGWPLTIFLTPDLKPFFAGTYYPKDTTEISIGLRELILNFQDIWNKKGDEVIKSADDITNALTSLASTVPSNLLPESALERAYNILRNSFHEKGGFGANQKFPSPNHLLFLLHYWERTGEKNALEMVDKTLDAMRMGGIWDHIGFGFHRYTVDPEWLIPHFEKMLYDQALMTLVYSEAYQATNKNKYRETAEQILEYVLRDMTSPDGGFYSAEDAESEGIEGKFYLWTKAEIERELNQKESQLFNAIYQIHEKGNYQDEATGLYTGKNILHIDKSLKDAAQDMYLKPEDLYQQMEKIREKLFKAREGRIHPQKDDKILTDWNGLMMAALARAGRTFNEDRYTKAALKAMNFIKKNLYRDGKLQHRYRDGEVKVNGYLDDYVYMIWGLLELYQTTLDSSLLEWALKLNQVIFDKFRDNTNGGFYLTSSDTEKVLIRKKDAQDASLPSGNAVAFLNLLQLSTLMEDQDLHRLTIEHEKAFTSAVNKAPTGYTMFLIGVMDRLGPFYEVVIAGERDDGNTQRLIDTLNMNYLPQVVFSFNSHEDEWLKENIESFSNKKPIKGRATAYVCAQGVCKSPTTDSWELLELLSD